MIVRVLVADENLDVHKLVNDILHISFKDVEVVRVMNADDFRKELRDTRTPFNLVLVAADLIDNAGKEIISIVLKEFPAYTAKMIVIDEMARAPQKDLAGKPIATINKPFSLDDFSTLVCKICAA